MSDAMHNYELVLIAVPQLDDEAVTALTQRMTDWIGAANGVVTNTNVWGRRQLAYAIRKQTEGIYVQFNYQMNPAASRELDRNIRLDEQIMRHLVIRTDED